jgi:hypothetical protein
MASFRPLNLPAVALTTREKDGRTEVFDPFRKRYVQLTAEEWVRQHFLMYLHSHLGYPQSLIAVEKSIKVNRMTKRFDIAVFDRTGKATMLIECKAPEIELTQQTLDQAGRYNLSLNVPYLIITNGIKHMCYKIDKANSSWKRLEGIPGYGEL